MKKKRGFVKYHFMLHEIQAGEWQRLKESKTYRKRTRQGKIIATHQALSNRLKQLETLFYQLVSNHPQPIHNAQQNYSRKSND